MNGIGYIGYEGGKMREIRLKNIPKLNKKGGEFYVTLKEVLPGPADAINLYIYIEKLKETKISEDIKKKILKEIEKKLAKI